MERLHARNSTTLEGKIAFDLYATLGFPLELTRDILAEEGLEVDEPGFYAAMEEHRIASGKGQAFAEMSNKNVEIYQHELERIAREQNLQDPSQAIEYDPYGELEVPAQVLSILVKNKPCPLASAGESVELMLSQTNFYVESGGQVGDTGTIVSDPVGKWEVKVESVSRPAAGAIVHRGTVASGTLHLHNSALARVDEPRRRSIMRNHTATHLLHAALRGLLGEKLHQAGSAVEPDRFRFDFNYPQALSKDQLRALEAWVNQAIQAEYPVLKVVKTLEQAKAEGAMALFGEKYGNEVRTIEIGRPGERISYELCGGTHVDNTAEIGSFYITSESSVAAGMRRIEGVTGSGAYAFARERLNQLEGLASHLQVSPSEALSRLEALEAELKQSTHDVANLRAEVARTEFARQMEKLPHINGVPVLRALIPNADSETLRALADEFRQQHPSGAVVLGSVNADKPILVAAVTPDLISRGLKAGEIVKQAATVVGGGGGGRPDLAQAGGKEPARLSEALDQALVYITRQLQ